MPRKVSAQNRVAMVKKAKAKANVAKHVKGANRALAKKGKKLSSAEVVAKHTKKGPTKAKKY